MTEPLPEAVPADDLEGGSARQPYAAIADFRYRLRVFLAFSERAALEAGLPPQQHQALLAVAGHRGDEPPSVGTLARNLLVAPHSAAELVRRMEQGGLLRKTASTQDRRRVELALTPKAEALLERLTAAHMEELRVLEPALGRALHQTRDRPGEAGRDAPAALRSSDR